MLSGFILNVQPVIWTEQFRHIKLSYGLLILICLLIHGKFLFGSLLCSTMHGQFQIDNEPFCLLFTHGRFWWKVNFPIKTTAFRTKKCTGHFNLQYLYSFPTLLEGLCPFPLPQARAASPIRTTSGNLLSNMYSTPSGNLSSPRSGK